MLHPADRPALKMRAKEAIKRVSPNIYLVSLVCLLLTGAPTLVTELPTLRLMVQADSVEEMLYIYQNADALVAGGVALSLATLAMSVFLSLVTCGWQLYALRVSREEEPGGLETLFACFQQFWRFLSAQLLIGLFTFLWSLLLVIPGIIAAYSYTQTIHIMLDHPEMSAMEAIAASKKLMRGHKFEYFVMELSFFGWSLLASLTLGILLIWLYPYMQVTYANYYNALSGWQPAEHSEVPFASQPEEWWKQ